MARKKLTQNEKERRKVIRQIKAETKKLNQRRGALLRENARLGVDRDEIDDVLVETWKARTGTKSKNRLAVGKVAKFGLQSAKDFLDFIKEYTGYKNRKGNWVGSHRIHYNTFERRKQNAKSLATLNRRYFQAGDGMTTDQYQKMVTMFNDSRIREMMEQRLLPSDQIVELAYHVNDGEFREIPQAIDRLWDMFKNAQGQVDIQYMRKMQDFNPDEFAQLLKANMQKDPDTRQQMIEQNRVFQQMQKPKDKRQRFKITKKLR